MGIIQFGILIFLETVYFSDNVSYSSSKVENKVNNNDPKLKLTLENGNTNTAASYDGSYLSYLMDNSLYVMNLENGDKTTVAADNGMEIVYYRWIYDRNRLILAEKPINFKYGSSFKLYYYDIASNSKVEITNEINNRNIQIPIYSKDDKVKSIEMSTLTNVIYVEVSNSNSYSRIYRINIMAQESRINTVTHNIGKIISTKRDDILLYENLNNKKVFRNGSNFATQIQGNSNLNLLGIDSKDDVYLGVIRNDKIQQIYYGNIANNNWQTINLNNSVNSSDIYISFNGQVFINDVSKSILKEIITGKETYYGGRIIGTYNDGIISEKNNEIIKTMFQ
jgi:hypothetical protein